VFSIDTPIFPGQFVHAVPFVVTGIGTREFSISRVLDRAKLCTRNGLY